MKDAADLAGSDDKIKKFFSYVQKTWFQSNVWTPRNVCAYQRLVRTNNDLEGYHYRLNSRCGMNHPPLYKLVEVLYTEQKPSM